MISNKEVRKNSIIIRYLLSFFIAWTFYTLYCKDVFSGHSLLELMVANTAKYIIWTAPVFLILRYVYQESPITYLKLNHNIRQGILYGLLLGSIIVAYHVVRNFIMGNGTFDFNIDLYTWVHRIILVGLTEEVVFLAMTCYFTVWCLSCLPLDLGYYKATFWKELNPYGLAW